MAAVEKDLLIEQGATFRHTFFRRDADKVAISLAGYEARMQIRESIDSDTVLEEFTTANGRITIEAGSETGRIDLYVGATDTEAMVWVSGVYDLELVETADPENVIRIVKGGFTVDPEVTRP